MPGRVKPGGGSAEDTSDSPVRTPSGRNKNPDIIRWRNPNSGLSCSSDIEPGSGTLDDTPERTVGGGGDISREDSLMEIPCGLSTIDSITPVVYGYQQVACRMKAKILSSGLSMLGFVWEVSWGEIDDIVSGEVKLNDEDITSVGGYSSGSYQERMGWLDTADGQTALDVISDSGYGNSSEIYPGKAMFSAKFNKSELLAGGTSLDAKCTVRGRLCYDFRTVEDDGVTTNSTYDTYIYTSNPILIIYDILTSEWPWTGEIDPLKIDEESWRIASWWCAEKISTNSMYSVGFTFEHRDTWAAANEVLDHCHCHISVIGDEFHMWYEGDVTPIPASTLTITDYFKNPEPVESELGTRTTELKIEYVSTADWDRRDITFDIDVDDEFYVGSEISKPGFIDSIYAYHWAQHKINLLKEIYSFSCVCGPEAANVKPGQIIWMQFHNGFGLKKCRITSVPTEIQLGKFTLEGRIWVGNVEPSLTVSGDTAGVYSNTVDTNDPDPPTGITVAKSDYEICRGVKGVRVAVKWVPPLAGSPVKHFEIWQGTSGGTVKEKFLGSTTGVEWNGIVSSVGATQVFSVCAVSTNGETSSPVTSTAQDIRGGGVNDLLGVTLNNITTIDGQTLVYKSSSGVLEAGYLKANVEYWTGIVCTATSTSIALTGTNPAAITGTVVAVVGGITAGTTETFDMSISGTNLVINKASANSTTFDVIFITTGLGSSAYTIPGSSTRPAQWG